MRKRPTPKRRIPERRRVVPERKLELRYIALSKLKLWKRNPRENDKAAERLAELITRHGFITPIIASRDTDKEGRHTIRAGATRYKAAKRDGLKEVPVILVDFDSEEAAQRFSLADNKASEWAKWKDDVLVELFSELGEADFSARTGDEMLDSGFTALEVDSLFEQSAEDTDPRAVAKAIRERDGTPAGYRGSKMASFLWFNVPSEKLRTRVLERYGIGSVRAGSRELDFEKIRGALLGK